jgi:hypothetical protein
MAIPRVNLQYNQVYTLTKTPEMVRPLHRDDHDFTIGFKIMNLLWDYKSI